MEMKNEETKHRTYSVWVFYLFCLFPLKVFLFEFIKKKGQTVMNRGNVHVFSLCVQVKTATKYTVIKIWKQFDLEKLVKDLEVNTICIDTLRFILSRWVVKYEIYWIRLTVYTAFYSGGARIPIFEEKVSLSFHVQTGYLQSKRCGQAGNSRLKVELTSVISLQRNNDRREHKSIFNRKLLKGPPEAHGWIFRGTQINSKKTYFLFIYIFFMML